MKQFNNSTIQQFSKGFAAMISVLAVMALGLFFSSGFLFVTLRNSEALKNEINSAQSYYTAEAGIEDAIYRVRYNLNTGISNTVTIGDFTATTTVVTAGDTKTIAAEGGGYNVIRSAQANLTIDANWTTQNSDFSFGNTNGAVITAVDSAGSVGTYSSLTLGLDGFARIS